MNVIPNISSGVLACLPIVRWGACGVPGKLAVRCSTRASWVTGLWAEFIAEMARHKISPSGMNCDWLIGDILIGDTSPIGGSTNTAVRTWMNSRRRVWEYDVMVIEQQCVCCLEQLHPSSLCFHSLSLLLFLTMCWSKTTTAAATTLCEIFSLVQQLYFTDLRLKAEKGPYKIISQKLKPTLFQI